MRSGGTAVPAAAALAAVFMTNWVAAPASNEVGTGVVPVHRVHLAARRDAAAGGGWRRRRPAGQVVLTSVVRPASINRLVSVTRPARGRARRTVTYRGYSFTVPRSWPVVDDRAHPHGCVRFDQHAIYLGRAGDDEFCPSWLLGTTESVLIEPGPARARRAATENPVARQITARAPGIQITATFDADPTVIYRILSSASLPAPVIRLPDPAGPRQVRPGAAQSAVPDAVTARAVSRMHYPMLPPALPAVVASYRGLGFDACAAPSRRTMRAWRRRSPYRAIGIYIGGADRACAQPNLTRSWVRQQAQAGWRFVPLYAGPQAAFGELHRPVREGRGAARDAAAQARRLGFGPRTPIYYDMEAYRPRARVAALKFLSAWTRELHRLRFRSGIYSSSDSGIVDLARQYGSRRYAMPDVIYDAWWNGSPSTRDRNIRRGLWHHQRIHQFSGNVTQRYGGHAINIDKDYLDVRIAMPHVTRQSTAAVTLPDGAVDVFYSRGEQIWFDRYVPGSGWAKPVSTKVASPSESTAVWTGSSVEDFYKDRSGYLWMDSYRADGVLEGRRQLATMGILGWGPRVVAQPDGTVDVFWRGSVDDHLWHGQYTPGSGWNGPQGLGGDLASAPSPVVSSPGITSVFWKGTDGSLWRVSRGLLGRWSAPVRLGMGPLGGPPLATAAPSGQIEVFWAGAGNPLLWEAFYEPREGWRGPRDLGGQLRSPPWPATAAGTVEVLWRGPGHVLDTVRHRPGAGWNVLGWQSPAPAHLGWVGWAPFAAAGDPGAALRIFWRGRSGGLWTAALSGGGWTGLKRL
ncbi:MAG TPA: glycoside hydrolase domain-containing protein [Streptosporangiaceae bacterium]|nr:glycoside hydrolase domain-containing protein [Streptosporangiaceae bacterium]